MNTAAALAETGKKVLMIDLDHQASLTKHTGEFKPDKNLPINNIYKVLLSYVDAENPLLITEIIKHVYGGPQSQDSLDQNKIELSHTRISVLLLQVHLCRCLIC